MPCQTELPPAAAAPPNEASAVRDAPAPEPRLLATETKRSVGSCLASFLIHALLLVVLAFWTLSGPIEENRQLAVATWEEDPGMELGGGEGDVTFPPLELSQEEPPEVDEPFLSSGVAMAVPLESDASTSPPVPDGVFSEKMRERMMEDYIRPDGGGWEGRDAAARAALVKDGGGGDITEGAVEAGLEWLQRHQHSNGSWTFGLKDEPCNGRCRNSSDLSNTTGATGLALLCFLGRNHTHMNESPYRETVEKGIYYLVRRIRQTEHGGDLQEGTMYAHGIATLALCEAYGLTRDPTLREYAQSCVNFIVYAQHEGGGWRYVPKQPGDTTVFGWQLMALKSARMAGLHVPSLVAIQANSFLDSVAVEDGAFYGYLKPAKEPTPTAVGLLCRMYMGWPHNHRPLHRGVEYLAARGPSKTDMYFNYYATQVMFHYRVAGWTGWNHRLSNYLVRTQAKAGHETGSWYFDDPYAEEAGRHYVTCLAIMILEVYYRYMPLYRHVALGKGL